MGSVAEVVCALSPDGAGMFMPMIELDEAHQREVYAAAGDNIYFGLSLLGESFRSGGRFLVRLADDRLVSFPFAVGQEIIK